MRTGEWLSSGWTQGAFGALGMEMELGGRRLCEARQTQLLSRPIESRRLPSAQEPSTHLDVAPPQALFSLPPCSSRPLPSFPRAHTNSLPCNPLRARRTQLIHTAISSDGPMKSGSLSGNRDIKGKKKPPLTIERKHAGSGFINDPIII